MDCLFQIVVLEHSKVWMPSYVNVNLGAEEKSIQVWNLCTDSMKGLCRQVHEWLFTANMIRCVRYAHQFLCKYISFVSVSTIFPILYKLNSNISTHNGKKNPIVKTCPYYVLVCTKETNVAFSYTYTRIQMTSRCIFLLEIGDKSSMSWC